jgi:hypothetical protein
VPFWLLPAEGARPTWWQEAGAGAALAAGMALEACLWAVLGVGALLGPLLVVEDCSFVQALGRWGRLLLGNLGRVFLFEALAVGVGLALALPCAVLLVPLWLLYIDPRLALAALCARGLLAGMAAALQLVYLLVANVFLYLHLRFATSGRRR